MSMYGDTFQDRKLLRSKDISSRDFVEGLKNLLKFNINDSPSMNDMASELFMSSRTFNRRLNRAGINYRTMITEIRKEESVRLLSDRNLDIRSISEKLGYNDPSNFTKAFRRWHGTSPSGYRDAHLL